MSVHYIEDEIERVSQELRDAYARYQAGPEDSWEQEQVGYDIFELREELADLRAREADEPDQSNGLGWLKELAERQRKLPEMRRWQNQRRAGYLILLAVIAAVADQPAMVVILVAIVCLMQMERKARR